GAGVEEFNSRNSVFTRKRPDRGIVPPLKRSSVRIIRLPLLAFRVIYRWDVPIEEFPERRISSDNMPFCIHNAYTDREILQRQRKPLFAVAQFLIGCAKTLFGPLALRNIDDGGEDEISLRGADRIEADFNGYFGAVLAQSEEIAPGAHGPCERLTNE